MRRRQPVAAASIAACLLLALQLAGTAAAAGGVAGQPYPNSSWALGVVAPEGAELAGGGSLHWEDVSNVTALVVLPNINPAGRMVYAVMSLMTTDGAVLQVAAGTFSNGTGWLSYSWFIPDASSIPIAYVWVLNASLPGMPPNSRASLSIFVREGVWHLRITSLETGAFVERSFPPGLANTLKQGDQEVFALESYTREAGVFQNMGNLTLVGLMVDGTQVTSGFYSYSDWNNVRNPLFAVGSSGTSAPGFVSLSQSDGSVTWSYSPLWTNGEYAISGAAIMASATTLSTAAIGALVVLFLLTKKKQGRTRLLSEGSLKALPLLSGPVKPRHHSLWGMSAAQMMALGSFLNSVRGFVRICTDGRLTPTGEN